MSAHCDDASEPSTQTLDRRVIAGHETTLLVQNRTDGTVTAHARGFTGVGRSVVEALDDLERQMTAVLVGSS